MLTMSSSHANAAAVDKASQACSDVDNAITAYVNFVSGGGYHNMALTRDGKVFAWGSLPPWL